MPELILGLLFICAFIGFAFYGFIACLVRLFGDSNDFKQNQFRPPESKLSESASDDAAGASRYLNFLLLDEKIDAKTYRRARALLEQTADGSELCERLDPNTETSSIGKTVGAESIDAATPDPLATDESVEVVADNDASKTRERKSSTAPWDIPDPPPAEPRRSMQEMLSGFMLDKNIRWGELASGILIVGSAVGLVISLRNELQDTIPYFSALMFLLITAAIHGAGIYTLKKWKLRNTSRGALLIGLLLIPLNFLAACILSHEETQYRELNDPLLWTAILVGLISFGTMTWFSGQSLLRKGHWPLMIAIMGCAIGTLIINRAQGIDESTLVRLILTLPLTVCFLVGTTLVFKQQWTRDRWPSRSTYRIFNFLGLSFFAFLAGAAMLVIRAEHNPPTWVTLAPSFSLVALIGSWFGHMIWKGAIGKEARTLSLTGLSMHIFGLSVIAVAWIISFANPMVLLITASLLSIGFGLFAYHRREPGLLIAGWAIFGSFVFCGVNLLAGALPWNSWASFDQIGAAALSGRSGISITLLGAAIMQIHSLGSSRGFDFKPFKQVGLIGGGMLAATGLGLTIAASFANPDNWFDNMAATSLLGAIASAAMGGCVSLASKSVSNPAVKLSPSRSAFIVFAVAIALLAALAHAFGWNLTLSGWLDRITFSINANWTIIFAAHAILLSILSATIFWRNKSTGQVDHGELCLTSPLSSNLTVLFSNAAIITGVVALFGCLMLIRHHTGLATSILALMAAGSWLFAWVRQSTSNTNYWTVAVSMMMALVVSVFTVEVLTKLDWCPGIDHPRHWMVQIGVLSTWFTVWLIVSWVLNKSQRFEFVQVPRTLTLVIGTGLVAALVLLVGLALAFESKVELFIDASQPPYSIANDKTWAFATLSVLGISLLVATFKEPSKFLGIAIITVWSTCWAIGSLYFVDQKAVATAMRWLLPVGGAVGAAMVAVRGPSVAMWSVARNRIGLRGRSVWPKAQTQQLINLSLALVAIVVMSLSTIAIVQVMMFGGVEALGGPVKGTLFGDMKKDVSYGLPVAIIVNTFLLYAVSERRKWLATAGSAVFQYCVLLSVVLLFVSPHPKLASSWFINILQAVSVGMTGYGYVWWYFRGRIEANQIVVAPATATRERHHKKSQLEIHSWINGVLITSLAVLVMTRFFRFPQVSGDWISSVGGPLGVGAWAMFVVLAYLVWQQSLKTSNRFPTWTWVAGWCGLVLLGMLAAVLDRHVASGEVYLPWMTFNLIMLGCIAVGMIQIGLQVVAGFLKSNGELETTDPVADDVELALRKHRGILQENKLFLPLLFTGLLAFVFSVRGMQFAANFWISFWASAGVIVVLTIAGFLQRSSLAGFVSAGIAVCSTLFLVQNDPQNWFTLSQPYAVNVVGVVLTLLALIYCVFYAWQTVSRNQPMKSSFVWMPNVVLITAALWLLLGAVVQWMMDASNASDVSCLKNSWGVLLFLTTALLAMVQLGNRDRKGLVVAGCLWWIGLTIFLAVTLVEGSTELHNVTVITCLGGSVALLGLFWKYRHRWIPILQRLQAPNLEKFESSLYTQLPIFGLVIALVVLASTFFASFYLEERLYRYLMAFGSFGLAIGFGCWSDSARRRWVQIFSLLLLTLGAIFLAWADLKPEEIRLDPMKLVVHAVLVLAMAMFIFGGVVSRFVRHGDPWLKSLREMALITCGMALTLLVVVVTMEFDRFVPDIGCGMPIFEAVAVAVAVIAMTFGLLVIAVRKENDPFALPLQARMGYVYAAQIVSVLLVLHLFFTMPFLFRFGIKEYWPYIVMIGCFAGVGVSKWLEQRELKVISQPIFNSAVILPVLVACAIWIIDSKADHALVTLTVGMAYLMIGYTHRSIRCSAAAILFGNLALWLFYEKFEGFRFLDHPQLWLIPPAISVLIAAQISRNKLTSSQLALIRYVCATTIYLSSTSEIFINGLGAKLWPPMVLAVLAVAGIFAGIMMQVRAYLYLGAVFLLMAMVTMVSHAHQRLDHVWPWWVFGITMGVTILVIFGLFEKRKNDLRQVVDRLKGWEH